MTESWPAWATAPVEVVEADPSWPDRARALREQLEPLLDFRLTGPIEHVGSTSIENLPAKPIIDLMAPVTGLDVAEEAVLQLNAAGWSYVPPDLDARPWRRFFVLPDGEARVAHLHLVEGDHPRWDEALRFRDALRRDRSLADEYAALKRRAADTHRDDREAYTEAKGAFVRRVLDLDAAG